MKLIYNHFIPLPGFAAMMLFGVIFARKKCKPLSVITINHEAIHAAQANECGGWWRFYCLYIGQWFKYGYRRAPFEREAYAYAHNTYYLTDRRPYAWRNYLKK